MVITGIAAVVRLHFVTARLPRNDTKKIDKRLLISYKHISTLSLLHNLQISHSDTGENNMNDFSQTLRTSGRAVAIVEFYPNIPCEIQDLPLRILYQIQDCLPDPLEPELETLAAAVQDALEEKPPRAKLICSTLLKGKDQDVIAGLDLIPLKDGVLASRVFRELKKFEFTKLINIIYQIRTGAHYSMTLLSAALSAAGESETNLRALLEVTPPQSEVWKAILLRLRKLHREPVSAE